MLVIMTIFSTTVIKDGGGGGGGQVADFILIAYTNHGCNNDIGFKRIKVKEKEKT